MAKVVHVVKDCIGCGACAAISPEFWEMNGDKSHLKGNRMEGEKQVIEVKDEKSVKANKEAANSCPVPCIFVED
ncbi:MAG: ferredoxin [Candidatus Diapherotrites archaeon]|nr:ferredoxin [Candidatus Diapherotrites archaeon]